jgi:NAD+ synthase
MNKQELKQTISYLRSEYKNYMKEHELKTAILGVSGGLDSAFIAALVHGQKNIRLMGFSMPTTSNKPDEIERAKACEIFCDDFRNNSIDGEVEKFAGNLILLKSIPLTKQEKIRLGNIKARVRMIYLYDFAQKYNGLVLGTDNLTEYNLGYWTLHGDVGDLGLIQNLWKTEVYELAQYLCDVEFKKFPEKQKALQDCINATPTDGNGITSSDLEAIEAKSYAEVDQTLQELLEDGYNSKWKNNPIVKRHLATEFKRMNPVNIEIDRDEFEY